MYDELVKRLRYAAHWVDKGLVIPPHMCLEAADAIEELRMKLHGDEAAIAGMKREIERMVVSNASNTLNNDAMRWIPVTERLPEEYTRVIGFMAWKAMTAIEYQNGKWYSIDHLEPLPDEAITHWMPLPEPPKEET